MDGGHQGFVWVFLSVMVIADESWVVLARHLNGVSMSRRPRPSTTGVPPSNRAFMVNVACAVALADRERTTGYSWVPRNRWYWVRSTNSSVATPEYMRRSFS